MIKPLQSITLKNDSGEDTTYVVASAPAIVETTEPADVASFSDGAEGIPVKSLIADINPVQNLNGQSAPYPAGGGKNKFPNNATNGTNTQSGITIKAENGIYTISGSASAGGGIDIPLSASVDLSPSTNKIAFMNNVGNGSLSVYFKRGTTTVHYWSMNTANRIASGWTASENEVIDTISLQWTSSLSISGSITVSPMLLALSESDLTWQPYSNICPITGWTGMNVVVSPTLDAQDGTTYPISWEDEAGTVYGGTLDVTTGLLTVTMASVDLGTLDWGSSTITNGSVGTIPVFRSAIGAIPAPPNANGKCSALKILSGTYSENVAEMRTTNNTIWVASSYWSSSSLRTIIRADAYSTVEAFTAAMSGVMLVYQLATPQTYQLTPQAVMTILGQNNIWADTGDVEVAYCADTKMYIDKMIAGL